MKKKKAAPSTGTTRNKSSEISQHQRNEDQIFFEYLQDHVASCSMVCEATGLRQKNCTRFKRDYEKANLLWELYEKRCDITGRKVAWLTTNSELVPNIFDSQLSLFEEGGGD